MIDCSTTFAAVLATPGHNRISKLEFASLLRSDTPECQQSTPPERFFPVHPVTSLWREKHRQPPRPKQICSCSKTLYCDESPAAPSRLALLILRSQQGSFLRKRPLSVEHPADRRVPHKHDIRRQTKKPRNESHQNQLPKNR